MLYSKLDDTAWVGMTWTNGDLQVRGSEHAGKWGSRQLESIRHALRRFVPEGTAFPNDTKAC